MTDAAKFDFKRALEALLVVLERAPGSTYHTIAIILYNADKLHLSRYGRAFSGDYYSAMKHGPVPSHFYDLLKFVAGRRSDVHSANIPRLVALGDLSSSISSGMFNSFNSKRPADLDYFSESELELT